MGDMDHMVVSPNTLQVTQAPETQPEKNKSHSCAQGAGVCAGEKNHPRTPLRGSCSGWPVLSYRTSRDTRWARVCHTRIAWSKVSKSLFLSTFRRNSDLERLSKSWIWQPAASLAS